MKERKERILFTPGMQCPGGCGRTLKTRDDLYKKIVMCDPCGRRYRSEYQKSIRYSDGARCAECQKPVYNGSTRCNRCSLAEVNKRPAKAKPGRRVDAGISCFPSLRGDGGEMAAEAHVGLPYHRRTWGARPC